MFDIFIDFIIRFVYCVSQKNGHVIPAGPARRCIGDGASRLARLFNFRRTALEDRNDRGGGNAGSH